VPSRVDQPAERETLTRDAARRASVRALRIIGAIVSYSAAQLADGMWSPAEARAAALDVATELELTARALRRIAAGQLDPAERRRMVAELAADGLSQRQMAARIGVHQRTIWNWLHDRR
jgi:DNA-binding NarL/FixJ family response regulator